MLYVGRFVKWFISVSINIFFILIAITFFYGALGVFYLHNTSNWNSIPLFIASSVIIFILGRHIDKKDCELKEKNKKTNWFFITIILFLIIIALSYIFFGNQNKFSSTIGENKFNSTQWKLKENSKDVADFFIFWDSEVSKTEKEKAIFVINYFDALKKESELIIKLERSTLTFEETKELEKLNKQHAIQKYEVEKILSYQVESIIRSEGLANPINSFTEIFIFKPMLSISPKLLPAKLQKNIGNITPVNLRLERKLNIIIISRRDKLEEVERIVLSPDITPQKREQIEKGIQDMNFSALIEGMGGRNTYPSTVVYSSLKGTISTIAHEWVHHYLEFQPFGNNINLKERRVIEETATSIIDEEISNMVWERFYASHIKNSGTNNSTKTRDERIDFGKALREIYKNVEYMLSEGDIEKAEKYMREQRDWLETEGHYIRKLNQAYFVLYSAYATNPAYQDANKGIGRKVLALRSQSISLKEFLDTISNIEKLEDLEKALRK